VVRLVGYHWCLNWMRHEVDYSTSSLTLVSNGLVYLVSLWLVFTLSKISGINSAISAFQRYLDR
jgi:hypothetical protein